MLVAESTPAIAELLADPGFGDVTVQLGARRTNDPFTVLLAIGTKSAFARKNKRELRRDGAPERLKKGPAASAAKQS